MLLTSYVAYYRVSTAAQGRSGLGLEAQRATIEGFLSDGDTLLAEFVEVQSGRKDNRTELAKALALAKGKGASILIARLDRFSRRVSFIAGVMESGVRLLVADLPNATEFQLHIFAALAQEERRLISERTRLALMQAKGRGVQLGSYGATLAVQNQAAAQQFAVAMAPAIQSIGPDQPLSKIAAGLNAAGYRSRNGRPFAPQTVKNLLARLPRELRQHAQANSGPD